jgi:hypothetical protein
MPGTPHGVPDQEPLRKRTAVMATGGADCEEIVAAPHEQHGFFADVPRQHAPVGKAIDRNALRKVGTGRIGLGCSHDDLQRTTLGRTNSWGGARGDRIHRWRIRKIVPAPRYLAARQETGTFFFERHRMSAPTRARVGRNFIRKSA